MRRLLVLLCVVASLAAPAAALAQSEPFGPLPQPAPQPTPPPPAPAGGTDDEEIGRGTLFLIGAGVLLSFFAIGFMITRDARRSLTDTDRAALAREEAGEKATTPEERRARAKAKRKHRERTRRQKAARKHNRPR